MEVRKIILERQSLFDVCIQHAGTAESCFDIAVQNNLSVTDDLVAGAGIEVMAVGNKSVADYYAAKDLKPASGFKGDGSDRLKEGIDYWYIGVDFVVQ